jgi:hypothetical protein
MRSGGRDAGANRRRRYGVRVERADSALDGYGSSGAVAICWAPYRSARRAHHLARRFAARRTAAVQLVPLFGAGGGLAAGCSRSVRD